MLVLLLLDVPFGFAIFISCFYDPQTWYSFSLFWGTGSNCLVLLRLLSFKCTVWFVFSLIRLKDFVFLVICGFSSSVWSCPFSSKLLFAIITFAIIFFIPCPFFSFWICCSSSVAKLVYISLQLALRKAFITSSAVCFFCLSFGISVWYYFFTGFVNLLPIVVSFLYFYSGFLFFFLQLFPDFSNFYF